MRPHPGPRFGLGNIVILPCDLTHHQDRAVLFVMILVFIGFVPGFELLHSVHRRVLAVDHLGGEGAGFMTIEAAAHQLVETRFITKAPARTMHRHETSAALDETLQIFPLLGRDRSMVRIKQDRVELV